MKSNFNIRAINSMDLTEDQFIRLNEVSQDMWAHSIGDFVQCKCCKKMMSKQDIFGHLVKEVYDETTSQIIKILGIKDIACNQCSGETKFIYGEENLYNIKERLLESKDSYLVICENSEGKIVGYADAYIETPEKVFNRELKYHYSEVGFQYVKERIFNILNYHTDNIIAFSSIGFLDKYKNPFSLFNILQIFFDMMSDDYKNIPGIMELDRKNPMYHIFKGAGGKTLGISDDPLVNDKINNKQPEYDSDLFLFDTPIITLRQAFSGGVREFIKQIRIK